MTVRRLPITKSDIPAVANFMHRNLNQRVAPQKWSAALIVPWEVESPNHGFFMADGDQVVGAYLAYYSNRLISDRIERFCNLGAWCVLDNYRAQGLRLLTSLLAQREYHFTDFSPSGNVIALNRRLDFVEIIASTALLPNIPLLSRRGGCHITSNPDAILANLSGPDLDIYLDHQSAAAARHILIRSEGDCCYVVVRRDRRKNVRAFASVLHVGNQPIFQEFASQLGSFLLTHFGAAATLVDSRVSGVRPRGSFEVKPKRPKMYKSATLTSLDIDYLYSELTCLEW